MTNRKATQLVAAEIKLAIAADRRGDAHMRNAIVSRILGCEYGVSMAATRKMLREAGLRK